jgi:ATP-dependent helicase HrpB
MGRESGVFDAEFIVALDVVEPARTAPGNAADAVVRMATAIERDWLEADGEIVEHVFDPETRRVTAMRTERYGAIALHRHAVDIDPEIAADVIARAYIARGATESDRQMVRRLACAGVTVDFDTLVRDAARGVTSLDDVDLMNALAYEVRTRVARDAPDTLPLPSGRTARLDYRDDGRVVAAAKLQELFGLAETPRIGPRKLAITFELLAPNGRPVQVTSDLKSFWTTGYADVRKALRGRYPRHPWPEDPWTATPTHRTKRRESPG